MNGPGPDRTKIIRATEEHLPAISELAGVIWRACYPAIISPAQIDYMLARMYASGVLRQEIQSEGICYDLLLVDGKPAGFASYGPTSESGVMKLHKLYLLPALHGRGLGSRLLQHCEREVRAGGAHRLILSVNKRNTQAVAIYKRNGFVIAESVMTDIGGGFVMDDYLMAKALTANPAGGGVGSVLIRSLEFRVYAVPGRLKAELRADLRRYRGEL